MLVNITAMSVGMASLFPIVHKQPRAECELCGKPEIISCNCRLCYDCRAKVEDARQGDCNGY